MSRSWTLCILSLIMFFLGLCVFQWSGGEAISLRVQQDGAHPVKEGEIGKVRVVLANHRASPFHVESVSVSCGCMQPKTGGSPFDRGFVLPEKSETPIDVDVDTTGKAGKAEHGLRVVGYFENPAKPYAAEARIGIEIVGGVRIVPTEVLLADAETGQPAVSDILILDGGSGDSAHVEIAKLSSKSISGQFEELDEREFQDTPATGFVPKRRYRLTYVPGTGGEAEQEYIDFKVPNGERETTFRVNILCRKKPPELVFSPRALSLATQADGMGLTREILCLSNGKVLDEVAVLSKPDDVRAVVKSLRERRHVVIVSIPSQRAAAGEDFTMRIGSPEQPSRAAVYEVAFETEHQ